MRKPTYPAVAVTMIVTALAFTGCGSKDEKAASTTTDSVATAGHEHAPGTPPHAHDSAAATDVKTYTFHGTPTKIDRDAGMITINHEKIGDFMGAMEMPFKVADPALFDKVAIGKNTHFTLRVAGTDMLITKVEDQHAPGHEH